MVGEACRTLKILKKSIELLTGQKFITSPQFILAFNKFLLKLKSKFPFPFYLLFQSLPQKGKEIFSSSPSYPPNLIFFLLSVLFFNQHFLR